ncbi:retropepsin-like aspartic protease family protein [Qipengyuania sp.]|uniref:retropepsin-like aspartic protease family protein n=1 Tax=Qipengyuania sp. TaxID=2004515 RepID=UPI003AF98138
MREAVLLALVVAVFVGITAMPNDAPDLPTDGAEAGEAGDAAAAKRADSRRDSYATWVAGTTELPRAADGHFYADAEINGSRVGFLVDTGASVVALTGADARAAGLIWSSADVRTVAQGASGPVSGVAVTLDSVALGGHEARNVAAVIVPEGLPVSLLGQSFLATVHPVRIERDRMVLGE